VAFDAPHFSSKAAVVCRGTAKTWAAGTKRAHEALRDVDLDIAPGEFVVFLGPSGCGKSTLLYLIAGLENVTEGGIWSFGDKIETPSPERSLIFQETSLFPWLTVWQNVSFGLAIRGASQAHRRAVAAEALQRVGLKAAMDKRPDELSGGMRQRVAVARALAMRPKVRVVVFTSRPGRIKTIMPIDLARPRNLFSREAEALRIQLTELLRDEVDRAFAEQEAMTAA
jgi:NitT/TauT family transport system ATP-binding protein